MGDSPWPAGEDDLVEQLVGFGVVYCEGGGAPSTVDTYIGGIMVTARHRGYRLTYDHRRLVRCAVADLAKDFPHEAIRSAALSLDERRLLVASLAPAARAGNAHALMWTAIFCLTGAVMSRFGEVTDTAFRWARVRVAPSGLLVLHLPWRKNSKGTYNLAQDSFVVPRLPPPLDARLAMEGYARVAGHALGQGDGVVFPRRLADGSVGRGTLYSTFNAEYRRLCAAAGIPDPPPHERRSSHGMGRRGGLNAYLAAGAPKALLGKVGGWRTEAGMLPYDESGPAAAAALTALMEAAPAGCDPGAGAGSG